MEALNKNGTIKRKHQALSIAKKVEILEKLGDGVSVKKICETYQIGNSTVYDIKKQKEKLLKFFSDSGSKQQMYLKKSITHGKSSELDEILINWYNLGTNAGVEISGELLREQAKIFHEKLGLQHLCDYSDGWLYRFKSRHGLKFRASVDNVKKVKEGTSIDKLITLTSELLSELKNTSFVTEKEIMDLQLIQDKLTKERTKLMKQKELDELIKKMAKRQKNKNKQNNDMKQKISKKQKTRYKNKSAAVFKFDNSLPSTSSHLGEPPPLPGLTTFPLTQSNALTIPTTPARENNSTIPPTSNPSIEPLVVATSDSAIIAPPMTDILVGNNDINGVCMTDIKDKAEINSLFN